MDSNTVPIRLKTVALTNVGITRTETERNIMELSNVGLHCFVVCLIVCKNLQNQISNLKKLNEERTYES